jgi:hypothetical protein
MPYLLRCLAGLLLAVLATVPLACRAAMADDAVLLASTVPGYAPGMVISFSDHLNLPDSAAVTLLFRTGEILRLVGPFEGTLEQQQTRTAGDSIAGLADMFRAHGVDATVIGGTRGFGQAQDRLDIEDVEIDPQHSGTYCLQQATSVWIARPTEDAAYMLRRQGSSRTIQWPSGAARIEWPADVPIDDGSQFEIATDRAVRATVTFRAVTPSVGSVQAAVADAILAGCRDQFDGELRRLSRAFVGPELWMTTDRGRQPTYRAGEPISLTVTSDVDGYLYCVLEWTGNGALPVFPGAAIDGAQVRSSTPLTIPGRRQPAGLVAAAGSGQIRCWLADRDITAELPHALLGSARLPDQLTGDLDSIFSRLGGPRIAAGVLTLRTE